MAIKTKLDSRSIPAWAGEPRCLDRRIDVARVYPRVGGGTAGASRIQQRHPGLSPRGRGNRHCDVLVAFSSGSIPAWAGEPTRGRPRPRAARVYPRVGGGT